MKELEKPELLNRNWPQRFNGVSVSRGTLDLPGERLNQLASLLSADELERAGRFRFPLHRDRFIAGRGCLREILASHIGTTPSELQFETGPYGKPAVAGIHFNVAHSENHLIIVVSSEPVGVDIETKRPLPEMEQLASEVFSSKELARWRTLSTSCRYDCFLALWTRKEALLKGIGLGITQHLKDVSVYFDESDEVEVPCSLADRPWSLHTVQEPDVTWSVAVQSHLA